MEHRTKSNSRGIFRMNEEEWDFGFTSEDELKVEVSTKVNDKATAIRDMVMPLLNNLKKNPDKDIIKWEGKQRIKQIDAFIKKMNSLVEG
jgi:hypothetical protein